MTIDRQAVHKLFTTGPFMNMYQQEKKLFTISYKLVEGLSTPSTGFIPCKINVCVNCQQY